MGQTATPEAAAHPWAKQFFAVTLFTDDLEGSKRFYQDVFEMPITNEDATSCAFRFPGAYVNLVKVESAPTLIEPAPVGQAGTPARMLLTLEVGDIDAVIERLRARGVTFLNGPVDRPYGRTAAFADPSGHCWELAI